MRKEVYLHLTDNGQLVLTSKTDTINVGNAFYHTINNGLQICIDKRDGYVIGDTTHQSVRFSTDFVEKVINSNSSQIYFAYQVIDNSYRRILEDEIRQNLRCKCYIHVDHEGNPLHFLHEIILEFITEKDTNIYNFKTTHREYLMQNYIRKRK
jgi:hypothetical protein